MKFYGEWIGGGIVGFILGAAVALAFSWGWLW